ncbi:MAG TPA: hypothetical protein VG015_05000 [Candidatus Dormibacteraeota bacterium]|nr:hypothetical protein [Candidatus Dormibacteraeota bacterium]
MSKKRVQSRSQGRRQVRQIKPKLAPSTSGGGTPTRKQRERYVASGGMLQGYDPELVLKIGYAAAGAVLVSILIMVELIIGPVGPSKGLSLIRIVAAIAWVIPIVLVLSFLAPGVRLAWTDRKAEARVVQGQLVGASPVSFQMGLGMIMINTRGGQEQFLCPPNRLSQVPGNQVNIAMTVTPGLKFVKSLSVMGQRTVARPDPPDLPVINQLRLLPLVTPLALTLAVILGDDVVAFVPIGNQFVHVSLPIAVAAGLAASVYFVSMRIQKRLMAEVQGLIPG